MNTKEDILRTLRELKQEIKDSVLTEAIAV